MKKRGKNAGFLYCNFFPKNRKGQFFLIATVIIIGLIAGFAVVTNSLDRKSSVKFYQVEEELRFESAKVIDYGINQGFTDLEMKNQLTTFADNYSEYSNADDFYYILGTMGSVNFAGLKKKSSGEISLEGATPSTISVTGTFAPTSLISSGTNINMTVSGTKYQFQLRTGQNFFFVVSKEIDGDVYVAANS